MDINVKYLAGSHANEVNSLLIHGLLAGSTEHSQFFDEVAPGDNTEIASIESFLVHPKALLAGKGLRRYIGSSPIQGHYGMSYFDDPEDEAAFFTLDNIGDDAYNENAVVLDGHDNRSPGLRYVRIGSLASRRTIAAANIVGGFDKFAVHDDSFTNWVLTGAILEESVTTGLAGHIEVAKRHYAGLSRLAGENAQSLDDHYRSIISSLAFYRSVEIPTLNEEGVYADYLAELERIKVERAFTPINLSADLRQYFVIEEEEVVTGLWGHQTMAPIIDTAGRRSFFGSLLCRIDPPQPDGSVWVKQKAMAQRRDRVEIRDMVDSDPYPRTAMCDSSDLLARVQSKREIKLLQACKDVNNTLGQIILNGAI
jgi:hypothetical protein